MSDNDDERSHPLYPRPEETYQRISLYPPKECDTCGHVSFEVEWKEITKTESNSVWIYPGTKFTVKTEMKKLCKRCFTLSNSHDEWGGLG